MKWRGNDGPQEVVIPEQRFMSCGGCKYHNHNMVKSGQHPIYAVFCSHPSFEQEWSEGFNRGRTLPTYPYKQATPDWCPYIVAPPRNILTEKTKK